MKKQVIIVIIFGSLIGYFFGKIFFQNYYVDKENIYYLQYGVYTSYEVANTNTEHLNVTHVIKEYDDKYYVYLGVTADYDVALKLQELYEEMSIYTYIRSDYVENSELIDVLKTYDKQLTSFENVDVVMKEIFDNYALDL